MPGASEFHGRPQVSPSASEKLRIQRLHAQGQTKDAALLKFVLKNLASRDFTVAVLILALLGMMEWFLWFTAIGSNAFWMVTAYLTRPSSPARA